MSRGVVVNTPPPFRQGDLDGLCGAYAVVNAVRLAALPHRKLRRTACAALFGDLVDELAEAGRLLLADSHDRSYFLAAKAFGDDVTANRLHLSSTFLLRVTELP